MLFVYSLPRIGHGWYHYCAILNVHCWHRFCEILSGLIADKQIQLLSFKYVATGLIEIYVEISVKIQPSPMSDI